MILELFFWRGIFFLDLFHDFGNYGCFFFAYQDSPPSHKYHNKL